MSRTIPTVPDDVTSLTDERLYDLHARIGEVREELRLAQQPVLAEVHRRETAALAEDHPRSYGVGGSPDADVTTDPEA